jgi:hypothetical protein
MRERHPLFAPSYSRGENSMETDNASDCGFDRETHIAHVRYLTHVAVGCYAVAALLGIAGTITAFLTSELQPLFAYLPAGLLAYIGEKYIERMHTEIVERIGEDGAAQVGVPLPILPMLHDWFFKRT